MVSQTTPRRVQVPPVVSEGLTASLPTVMQRGSSEGMTPSKNPSHSSNDLSSTVPPPTANPLTRDTTKIFDDATVTAGYESVPLIEIDTLPRGGISFETKAVGRVQVS